MEELIFAMIEIICEMLGWGAKFKTICFVFVVFICIIFGIYWYNLK